MTHRVPRAVVAAAAVLAMGACGVSTEDQPQPITDTASPDTGPTPSVNSSPDTATPTPGTPATATTGTATTTSTSPTHPPRLAPPDSTEPSATR